MGMMNVLMQLRKVCNHPDLFEPRSVVTPFVLNRITMPLPDCVVDMANNEGVLRKVSTHLLSPLWCGSGATPSIDSSFEHDEIHSMALLELEDRGSVTADTLTAGDVSRDGKEILIKIIKNRVQRL